MTQPLEMNHQPKTIEYSTHKLLCPNIQQLCLCYRRKAPRQLWSNLKQNKYVASDEKHYLSYFNYCVNLQMENKTG